MRVCVFLRLLAGATLFAAAVYALLAAPGLLTHEASTVPAASRQEVLR